MNYLRLSEWDESSIIKSSTSAVTIHIMIISLFSIARKDSIAVTEDNCKIIKTWNVRTCHAAMLPTSIETISAVEEEGGARLGTTITTS